VHRDELASVFVFSYVFVDEGWVEAGVADEREFS
jgi:hypothetical protein